jgi:hypothetical protein
MPVTPIVMAALLASMASGIDLGPAYFTKVYGDGAPSDLSFSDVDVVDVTHLSAWYRLGFYNFLSPWVCIIVDESPIWGSSFRPRCELVIKRDTGSHPVAASGQWVEVSHGAGGAEGTDNASAAWFYIARGTGIYVNIGKTAIFRDHPDAVSLFLNESCKDDQCNSKYRRLFCAAEAKGYNSLQFTHHDDQVCGNAATELVVVGVEAAKGIGYHPYHPQTVCG